MDVIIVNYHVNNHAKYVQLKVVLNVNLAIY